MTTKEMAEKYGVTVKIVARYRLQYLLQMSDDARRLILKPTVIAKKDHIRGGMKARGFKTKMPGARTQHGEEMA